MEHVEPASSLVAKLFINYKSGEKDIFFIPLVEKYASDEQEESAYVYTHNDLLDAVSNSLDMGLEGTLMLPALDPAANLLCYVWVVVPQLERILIGQPHEIAVGFGYPESSPTEQKVEQGPA